MFCGSSSRFQWPCAALIAACLCSVLPSSLQGQQSASVTGTVEDAQHGTIAAARVRVFRQDASSFSETTTDDAGHFRFDRIAPGALFIEVQKQGFQTQTVQCALASDAAISLEITLAVRGVNQTIVVTAAGEAQAPGEVSKSLSVISHDEIVNRNDSSITSLLTTVPGVQIFNQGGPGEFTSMSIRGLPGSAGAVLVDGLRLRDASTTQGDASPLLPILNVIDTDRVEVLRGSGSSLYGTNAVGGAVNLVTNEGGAPMHGDAQVEGGNLALFRARGGISGGAFNDRLKYSAGILHLNVMSGVDGQDANRSSGLQGFMRYDFAPKLSLSGRFWGSDDLVQTNNSPTSFGVPFSNVPSTTIVPAIPLSPAGVKTLLAGGTPDFGNATYIPNVNDPDARASSRFENAAFIFRHLASARFSWQGYYQLVHTNRVYENGPLGVGFQPQALDLGEYSGTIHTAGIRATGQVTHWFTVSGGYEFEREQYFDHQDNNLPDPTRVVERTHAQQNSNAAFFASQLSLLNRRLQASLSGRAQYFDLSAPRFEYSGAQNPYAGIPLNAPNALTGDASIAYLLPKSNTKLRAHAGNSFRSPSLFERFGAGFFNDFTTGAVIFSPYGDPRLAPDRYNSADAGIDQYLFRDRARISATAFYIRAVQLIAFDFNGNINPNTDPFGRSSGYLNGSGGISRGAEVSVETRPFRGLSVSGAYTYTNADNDRDSIVPGFFGVFNSPKHTTTLVATKQWGRRLTTTVDLFHYSRYFNGSIGFLQAYQLPGFTNTGLAASYQFWDNDRRSARVYARVSNIFNQTYYVAGSLAPGTTFVTGLGYAF